LQAFGLDQDLFPVPNSNRQPALPMVQFRLL
jgi:hypothetical protein